MMRSSIVQVWFLTLGVAVSIYAGETNTSTVTPSPSTNQSTGTESKTATLPDKAGLVKIANEEAKIQGPPHFTSRSAPKVKAGVRE